MSRSGLLIGISLAICTALSLNAQVPLTSSGSSNTFDLVYPANVLALSPGFEITFFSNQTITSGGVTLNVNGTGARSIVKNVNQPLNAGDILTGQAVKVIYSSLGNWQLISVSPTNASSWSLTGNATDSTFQFLGTTNNQPLALFTNGIERMRISRAGRFGFNMNPTPSAMFNIRSIGNGAILTVNRSSDAGALIELTETPGGNARIDIYNSVNANVVQIPSGPGNIFFAGGGNLGVGTTSPGNNLHVVGGARISNLAGFGPVFSNTSGDLFLNTGTGINIWTISGTNITPQVRSRNLALGPDGISYIPLGDNSVMLGFDGGEVFYETNSGDMSEGMLMHSGGNNSGIIKNIAVGAGAFMTGKQNNTLYIFNRAAEPILFETNNTTRMSVSGTGTVSIRNLTSTGNFFVQASSLGDLFISTTTGQAPFWALGGNSVSGVRALGTTNAFELPIITNNVERIRILNNGYFRMGDIATATTAGPKRLVISYDGQTNLIHMLPNGNATTAGYNLGGLTFSDNQAPTVDQALIVVERDGVSTGATDLPTRITFSTTPAGSATFAERMRINAAGDIGIGSISPTSRLHVYDINTTTDGIGGTFIDVSNHTNTNNIMSGIRFRNTSTDVRSYKGAVFFKRNDGLAFGRGDLVFANRNIGDYNPANLTDAKFILRANGQALFNTSASGLADEMVLGSGIGSPTFAINGGDSVTGAAFGLSFFSNSSYRAGFGYSPVVGQDYVFLYEGGTNSFISKGGLIGINTQTPAANLDVNGTFVLGSNGSVLTEVIKATVNIDIGSVSANSGTTVNLTVPGATVGSTAMVSPSGSFSLLIGSVRVPSINTVQLLVFNPTGLAIDPPALNFFVTVIR